MAQQTGLSPYSIKKWFYNTRYTEKKKIKDSADSFNNPATYSMSGSAQSDIPSTNTNQPCTETDNMDQSIIFEAQPEVSQGGGQQQMRGPIQGLPMLTYHGPRL